jgi:hypothetical protein
MGERLSLAVRAVEALEQVAANLPLLVEETRRQRLALQRLARRSARPDEEAESALREAREMAPPSPPEGKPKPAKARRPTGNDATMARLKPKRRAA